MIHREIYRLVQTRLQHFDSVALIGPRQVGKTTLAHQIAADWDSGAKYLDLENPMDRRLLDDPVAYLSGHSDKLVVLDEIHRVPEIFQILRGQIDQRRRMSHVNGKFLMLGSASMDLLRQSSETLAGRISFVEMNPLTLREIQGHDTPGGHSPTLVDRLWLHGGFPLAFLRSDAATSLQWRTDFIRTYLERDLPQFGLQVATDYMDRFWRMLAHDQGELYNAQRYARSLGTSGNTVTRHLQVLQRLLMIRLLPPWLANEGKRLTKSHRAYLRDSGILHAMMNLRTLDDLRSHPIAGKSWEGFAMENLISSAAGRAKPYFYRTAAGAEIDLVLEFTPNDCWAIEIKLSSAPSIERGYFSAVNDIRAKRRIVVHKGEESFPMRHGIEAMPLLEAMNEVSRTVTP